MTIVSDVYEALQEYAPLSLAQPYDNPGFLVGWKGREVRRILIALDILPEVIGEAAEVGAELIVSHHPVIFDPISSVTDGDFTGVRALSLIERGISAICMHTNLDAARGGVNDCLASRLGLSDVTLPFPEWRDESGEPASIARCGTWTGDADVSAFSCHVKEKLNAPGLKIYSAGKPVRRVAVGGGACGSYLARVYDAGCDTFVTSELKLSHYQEAAFLGLNVIDAGHFSTEHVVIGPLAERLRSSFPHLDVRVSAAERDIVEFL